MTFAAIDDLARLPRPAGALTAALSGQVRGALLRDWAELAGPALARQVGQRLWSERLALPTPLADDAWVQASAYLRLHDLLIELGHGGDGVRFAQRWRQEVGARIPPAARWAGRAMGVRRGMGLLPRLWPQAWDLPAPTLTWGERTVTVGNFAHPAAAHPTFRLLLALQLELAGHVLGGPETVAQVQTGAEFGVRLSW